MEEMTRQDIVELGMRQTFDSVFREVVAELGHEAAGKAVDAPAGDCKPKRLEQYLARLSGESRSRAHRALAELWDDIDD